MFRDAHVHPVATEELTPMVFVGQQELGGRWSLQIPLFMHLEALPVFSEHQVTSGDYGAVLAQGLRQIISNNPFVTPSLLSIRAHRAHWIDGDYVDAVTTLETAMESRLFAICRCLYVDLGYSSSEIAATLNPDTRYRTLIVSTLPRLLGGRWDTKLTGSPVGDYWAHLYLLRNRVVHGGYQPSAFEATRSRQVHDALRDFVRSRLWQKRWTYPRSAALYIMPADLERNGGEDASFAVLATEFQAETNPFFQPWDVAGRTSPPSRV
jgi:hypothetical protein